MEKIRVKISAKKFGIDKLEFGKIYALVYIGTTAVDEFVFTRKKVLKLVSKDSNGRRSHQWISKRVLKRMLNSGYINWVMNLDENE